MDLELAGRVALVTGASRGIGLAIASQLVQEGAKVGIVARDAQRLEAAAQGVGATAIAGDLLTADGCRNAHDQTIQRLGPVEILVNNLGGRAGTSWSDTDVAELEQAMATNLYPAVTLSRLVLPAMRAAKWGRILVVTSIWGREAGGAPAYNVAKAAEISVVTSLGREVAGDGITVNAIAPGSVVFEGGGWHRRVQADPDGMAEFVKREMPLGRFGTPEEVAAVAAFLCSPRASYVNAACWTVDGGQSRSNI